MLQLYKYIHRPQRTTQRVITKSVCSWNPSPDLSAPRGPSSPSLCHRDNTALMLIHLAVFSWLYINYVVRYFGPVNFVLIVKLSSFCHRYNVWADCLCSSYCWWICKLFPVLTVRNNFLRKDLFLCIFSVLLACIATCVQCGRIQKRALDPQTWR